MDHEPKPAFQKSDLERLRRRGELILANTSWTTAQAVEAITESAGALAV